MYRIESDDGNRVLIRYPVYYPETLKNCPAIAGGSRWQQRWTLPENQPARM